MAARAVAGALVPVEGRAAVPGMVVIRGYDAGLGAGDATRGAVWAGLMPGCRVLG